MLKAKPAKLRTNRQNSVEKQTERNGPQLYIAATYVGPKSKN